MCKCVFYVYINYRFALNKMQGEAALNLCEEDEGGLLFFAWVENGSLSSLLNKSSSKKLYLVCVDINYERILC